MEAFFHPAALNRFPRALWVLGGNLTSRFGIIAAGGGPNAPPACETRLGADPADRAGLRGRVGGEARVAVPDSGPGLAFCKLAIEAHGGQIGVESKPGHSSTFWFTLPLSSATR